MTRAPAESGRKDEPRCTRCACLLWIRPDTVLVDGLCWGCRFVTRQGKDVSAAGAEEE